MTEAQNLHIPTPCLYLVYATPELPAFDQATLTSRLQTFPEIQETKHLEVAQHEPVSTAHWGEIRFGQHHIQFSGLPNPLPNEIIDHTVHTSQWKPQIKMAMRQHQSHISLVYTGTHHNPIEKMIALYQAASAFSDENLVGILNPEAWVAHPPADFLSTQMIATYRQHLPFSLWFGYIKYFVDKTRFWLVTRGHHIFDVPDLAYFVQAEDRIESIIRDFNNIFYYIYEEDVFVTAGDTFTLAGSDQKLEFLEVAEENDFLMGPSGTLVIAHAGANLQ